MCPPHLEATLDSKFRTRSLITPDGNLVHVVVKNTEPMLSDEEYFAKYPKLKEVAERVSREGPPEN
jgi:hypothetical protein